MDASVGHTSPLETLPGDMIAEIMILSDTPEDLLALVHSCPLYYHTFRAMEKHIIKSFLNRHVGPKVLPEATICYRLLTITDQHPESGNCAILENELVAQLNRLSNDRILAGEPWTFNDGATIFELHKYINWLAETLLNNILNEWPSLVRFPSEQTPSSGEIYRTERALFLLQAWTGLSRWSQDRETSLEERHSFFHDLNAGIEQAGRETDDIMHKIALAFETFLPVVHLDQIRSCGIGLVNMLAQRLNDALYESIDLPLAQPWNTPIDNEKHWISTRLLLEGLPQFQRMLEGRDDLFEWIENAWSNDPEHRSPWPEDTSLQSLLESVETQDNLNEDNHDGPIDEYDEIDKKKEEEEEVAWPSEEVAKQRYTTSYDDDVGPTLMSLCSRPFWKSALSLWLPSWGYVLWDSARLDRMGFAWSYRRGKYVCEVPAEHARGVFKEWGDWDCPLDMDEAFEPALAAREILADRGHSGWFDFEAFGAHWGEGMSTEDMDFAWCLEHYHKHAVTCPKCEETKGEDQDTTGNKAEE